MSSAGLNKWIVSGNLAADAEIKTVELKSGEKAKVAEATIYIRKPRSRDESFTVKLSIWEGSTAWRKLPFLKKGSLIICTGSVDVNPYISSSDNLPRAGLAMNVLDVDLDTIRNADDEADPAPGEAAPANVADRAAACGIQAPSAIAVPDPAPTQAVAAQAKPATTQVAPAKAAAPQAAVPQAASSAQAATKVPAGNKATAQTQKSATAQVPKDLPKDPASSKTAASS